MVCCLMRGVRSFFAKSHIPGLSTCTVNDFDKGYENVRAKLKQDGRIVIYCSSLQLPG